MQINLVITYKTDLFNLNEVSYVPVLVDTSLHVSGSGIPPGPPGNQDEGTILGFASEIQLVDISIYNRHDPFLFEENSIEILYQIVVP